MNDRAKPQSMPRPPALTPIHLEVPISIVDIGASPLDGKPPYRPLLKDKLVKLLGFEPQEDQLAALNKSKAYNETYLPHVIGDGKSHTLHICRAPGMTSLLVPNIKVLEMFHGFAQWATIEKKKKVKTMRLDDVPQARDMDYLKIDIQGAELMVFENAQQCLRNAVVVHTEVEFMPLYVDQPLFSDVDQFLRAQGFMLHRFQPLVSRTLKPVLVNNSAYAGLSQLLAGDAVYIRDIVDLDAMNNAQLLKMATILHNCYQSIDVVTRLLVEYDARVGQKYGDLYKQLITGKLKRATASNPKAA